jgi:NADH:ubiquinone oxidoreductase subunit E/ferredoxin
MLVGATALETFYPVGIIALILFVVTVLLAIADKLLVSYGECKITVRQEDETKEFTVEGGGKLLTALIDNGMKIPASCGGRGSCGFCKVNVASGGGQVLPTEEVFLSKEEERAGSRLACQVKVKNDIELFVPDLLTTVKGMAKNGTFDTRLKWRFRGGDDQRVVSDGRKVKLDRKSRRSVDAILEKHENSSGTILPILHDINAAFLHLPEPALRMVSEALDIPFSTVFTIATFYNAFSLEPKGRHVISVCMGTACYIKGSPLILESFERELGIKVGETTGDSKFTLKTVSCVGCCGQSPVITVNEHIYGYLKLMEVPQILNKYS